MPDESCRHCGGTLVNYTKCAECNQVNRMICKCCGTKTLEQVHTVCMYYVETHPSAPNITTGNYSVVA